MGSEIPGADLKAAGITAAEIATAETISTVLPSPGQPAHLLAEDMGASSEESAPPAAIPDTAERFGQSWTLYQEKRFAEAETMFRECLSVFPQDKVAQIYIERCQQMLKAGFV